MNHRGEPAVLVGTQNSLSSGNKDWWVFIGWQSMGCWLGDSWHSRDILSSHNEDTKDLRGPSAIGSPSTHLVITPHNNPIALGRGISAPLRHTVSLDSDYVWIWSCRETLYECRCWEIASKHSDLQQVQNKAVAIRILTSFYLNSSYTILANFLLDLSLIKINGIQHELVQ